MPFDRPFFLLLKATGKDIKNAPGMVLYGNPPRWHHYDAAKHTDPSLTHYQATKHTEVKAAQKIAAEASHAHDESGQDEHIAKMKSLAAEHQAKASASAAVTGWKQSMQAGKKPAKSQHDAMLKLMDADPKKAEKIAKEVVDAIGAEKYQSLLDQAEGKAAKPAKAEADPKALLQEAIDHLSKDTRQKDLPASEKKEDAALVAKLKTGVADDGPKEDPPAHKNVTVGDIKKDAKHLSENEFLDKYVGETLNEHMDHNLKPETTAQVQMPVGDLDPTEWDDWDEYKAFSGNVMPKSHEKIKKMIEALKNGAELPPVLAEGDENGADVIDGHHRAAAYMAAGKKTVPVIFNMRSLLLMWADANGVKATAKWANDAEENYRKKHLAAKAAKQKESAKPKPAAAGESKKAEIKTGDGAAPTKEALQEAGLKVGDKVSASGHTGTIVMNGGSPHVWVGKKITVNDGTGKLKSVQMVQWDPAWKKVGGDAPAPAPKPAADKQALHDGWLNAIKAGKTPTKAQAEAIERLKDDGSIKAKDLYSEAIEHHVDQSGFSWSASHKVVHDMHAEALADKATKPSAPPEISPGQQQDLIQWVANGKPGADTSMADVHAKLAPAQQEYLADKATEHPSFGGWKSALLAGKTPTPEQHAAKNEHLQKDHMAVADATNEVVGAIGSEKYLELVAPHYPEYQKHVQKLNNLDKIPWDAFVLPDSNTNAKSNNAKVAKIKEAAFGGNVAALQAMTFGSNSYGKKRAKLAQTAIAALQEPEPAAPAAETGPKEGDTKTENGRTYQLINGKWHRVDEEPKATTKMPGAPAIPDFGLPHFKEAAKKMLEVAAKEGPSAFEVLAIGDMKNNATKLEIPGGKTIVLPNDEKGKSSDAGMMLQFYDDVMTSFGQGSGDPAQAEPDESAAPSWKPDILASLDAMKLPDTNSNVKSVNKKIDKLAQMIIADDFDGIKAASWGSNNYGKKIAAKAKAVLRLAGQGTPVLVAAAPKPTSKPVAIDGWSEQPGTQKGSNHGGLFTDPNGQQWYVKFPKTEAHVKNELLAAKLYQAAGVAAPELQSVTLNGKAGIASKWKDGLVKVGASIKDFDGALDGFAVDAWLGNYDSVGTGYDNMLANVDGKAVRIDVGGSLLFRAQGAEKTDFSDTVTELATMIDPSKNAYAAAVFGGIADHQIKAGVVKIAGISDAQIQDMVRQFGPGTKAEQDALADKLIARRADLLAKYPVAEKEAKKAAKPDPTKLTVDPSKLPQKPNFHDWPGKGGQGLSGVDAVNTANQNAVDEIEKAALAGNFVAVKSLNIHIVDKNTGDITVGLAASHPSQWVKQYYSSVVEYMDVIANPSAHKATKWSAKAVKGAVDLSKQFKAHLYGIAVGHAPSNQRLGFWISLGNAAKTSLSSVIPKAEFWTKSSDKTKGEASINKMPSHLKKWMQAVKSSGSANQPYRDGEEIDSSGLKTRDVLEAAYQHAVEFEPGTRIRKGIDMPQSMLNLLLQHPAGHVFQNPGSMCCSLKENWEWSGMAMMEIVYAPGAKALYNIGVGAYDGEGEITTLPGQRFMLLEAKKTPDEEHENYFKVLMLPPDENYVNNIQNKAASDAAKQALAGA